MNIEVFLFHYINGIEHLGHDVQLSTLRCGLFLLRVLEIVPSSNRDADNNIDDTQEPQGEDQGLQNLSVVEKINNPENKENLNLC